VQLNELNDLDIYKNKELIFAGIVSGVEHKVSKKGKPFGQFTLEDYAGSMQFTLFSEDYVRYKALLEKSNFLFVKARVQLRFNSDDTLEVRVNQLIRLADVSGQLARNINIKVALTAIDEEWIDRLHALCLQHPGKCDLNIIVIDNELRYSVELPSKSIRVAFCHDLLSGINDLMPLSVTVN
jgi:DNA polymerase-3 subunit alpha